MGAKYCRKECYYENDECGNLVKVCRSTAGSGPVCFNLCRPCKRYRGAPCRPRGCRPRHCCPPPPCRMRPCMAPPPPYSPSCFPMKCAPPPLLCAPPPLLCAQPPLFDEFCCFPPMVVC
jgi:hypothetical protein